MDGWKALVMIVAIVGVVGLSVYIFNEVKKAKIMQAKAEAVAGVVKGATGFVKDVVPFSNK